MKRSRLYSAVSVSLLLVVSLFSGRSRIAFGQSPPQAAIRFANASAIPGKVLFTNDTRKLRPDGFGPGDYTSSIGTPAGSHRFGLSATGAKAVETATVLQANTATTFISFVKPVLDPATRQTTLQLQLYSQGDSAREKGKHFYLLYVSPRPAVDLIINGQPKNVPALRQFKVNDVAHGSIKVESGGNSLVDFAAQQNGNFLAIVFDKPDGSLSGMLVPDYD